MTLTREIIETALNRPLEGRQAWSRFAPELTYGRHRIPPPHDARQAAVLILLYEDRGQWRLPLIRRAPDVTVHSGQVSLPGGQSEPAESPEVTALREFEEELGARPGDLELCGRLTSTYIYASNYFVTPCVAIASSRPHYQPNPREVADVLEPGLPELADHRAIDRIEIHRRGLIFQAPSVVFQGHQIWGATSMMLAELIARLPTR